MGHLNLLEQIQRKRATCLGLIVVLVLTCGATAILWQSRTTQRMRERRAQLLPQPFPTPAWTFALMPAPGQTRPLAIDQNTFGVLSRQFWPAMGTLCVQLDPSAVGETTVLTSDDLTSRVLLSLNGSSIRQVDVDFIERFPSFIPTYVLIHGPRFVEGYIEAGLNKRKSAVNVCWMMKMKPGEYLASLLVKREVGPDLEYEWAFHLTED